MKKKDGLDYFEKEWKELQRSLKAWYNDEEPEDLHRFRVQVKKLRAFITLAESDRDKHPLKKRFKPVRRIFKRAGEIRDAYLHVNMIRDMKLGRMDILKEQCEIQNKAGKEFEACKKDFFKDLKESHRSLIKKIRSINDAHIIRHYNLLLQQIAKRLVNPKFDNELHGCRKLLKSLIYNYKLAQPVIDPPINEDYLQDIQAAIGEWHDQAMVIDFFDRRGVKHQAAIIGLKKQEQKLKAAVRKLGKDFYQRGQNSQSSNPQK
ncbi:MAG: CHAD domain-containing protein [Daejeonella sp.]|uniref:CHAD domain-containing protein n=1 Tax=Daejeonella sp. JGW-45 TaxID=3034148 RepID=UPI0023EE1661|nr:CHAD domain-containing protein [Daejeonella sp. JGW-45]